MKKILVTLLAIGLVFGFAPVVMAGGHGHNGLNNKTSGNVDIEGLKINGDGMTGGYGALEGSAEYSAEGRLFVMGSADAEGKILGGSIQGRKFAVSGNLVSVNSDADALALLGPAKTKAKGEVEQGNWATVISHDGLTGAMGENTSEAGYFSNDHGLLFSDASGCAITGGLTVVSKDLGRRTNESDALTANFALANGEHTWVKGSGDIQTLATKVGEDGYAQAGNEAEFMYRGQNAGAGFATGHSEATMVNFPGGMVLKASTHSAAGSIAD